MALARLKSFDGGSIRYTSLGAGPTVLLAHGYLLDLTLWRHVVPALGAAGKRVVVFEEWWASLRAA